MECGLTKLGGLVSMKAWSWELHRGIVIFGAGLKRLFVDID